MTTDKKIGYARVSSESQNLDRQLEQFKSLGLDKIFQDKVSGKDTNRPAFQEMMDFVREGDEVFVCSMDRMARSLRDLLAITQQLKDKGVTVHFLKENLHIGPNEKSTPASNLLMAMMGAVAEFERELIRERQREGIAIAKTKGVYKGRAPINPEILAEANRRIEAGVTIARVARDLKIGQSTLFRYRAEQRV